MTTTGIRWISWHPGDGFGDAALGYVGALESIGVPVTWTPMAWRSDGSVEPVENYRGPLAHLVDRAIDHDTVVVHLPPGDNQRWLREGDGRRTLLYTTWETECLPDHWATACADFDAVLVPSTFNRDAFVASGCPTEVHVLPHCARRPPAVEPARFERIGDRYVFYVIATWSTRKAMPETITAFLDAFDADDDVALVVKTTSLDQQAVARARRGLPLSGPAGREKAAWASFASLVAGRGRVPEMHLIPGRLPADQLDAIHARGDCYFSLTRSEGWGLCIADALLFGNPVVVTGWGGHLDYLGDDYPLLVDHDLVSTAQETPDDWFDPGAGQRWARARHDDAVERLRWVADHREDAAGLGAGVGAALARDCDPAVIGRRLLELLR